MFHLRAAWNRKVVKAEGLDCYWKGELRVLIIADQPNCHGTPSGKEHNVILQLIVWTGWCKLCHILPIAVLCRGPPKLKNGVVLVFLVGGKKRVLERVNSQQDLKNSNLQCLTTFRSQVHLSLITLRLLKKRIKTILMLQRERSAFHTLFHFVFV